MKKIVLIVVALAAVAAVGLYYHYWIAGEGEIEIVRVTLPNSVAADARAAGSDIFTEIRAVPYFIDGRPRGLKVLSVKGGSFFERIGVLRGDILVSIGEVPIDIKEGIVVFGALFGEGSDGGDLTLERDGKPVVIRISYGE